MGRLRDYYNDPFGFLDNLQPSFRGHVFNPFRKFRLNRKLGFFSAIFLGLIPWVIYGFDSCIAQPLMFLYKLPELFSRTISYNQLLEQSFVAYYGKEMHFSAFLIYGLMFWFLSRHYDKRFGITGSKNIAYAASITLLSVAVFEWFWILSFAIFQGQGWVATFRFPQAKILLQNLGFSLMGGLGILYMWVDSHILNREGETIGRTWGFRWTSISFSLIGLSVALAFLWIIYPFPIQHIQVPISTGEVWTNSPMFPQTLYTIDIDPTDSMNAGVQYYVENNYVHGLNTLVKAVVSLSFVYVGWIRKSIKVKH